MKDMMIAKARNYSSVTKGNDCTIESSSSEKQRLSACGVTMDRQIQDSRSIYLKGRARKDDVA
jgi:hypothetical protein